MKLKLGLAGALFAALCGTPTVSAQAPMLLPPVKEGSATVPAEPLVSPLPPDASILPAYDSALFGTKHPNKGATATCCGPVGGNGPIDAEIYVLGGPNFILSDTAFGRSLKTGYEIGGGGRSLFFNPDRTGAFIMDLNVAYTYNDGKPAAVLNFAGAPVTIRGLDRTAVGLGLGYDWYLLGPGGTGCDLGRNFRVGFDGGAKWGTSHVDMNIVGTVNGYLRHQDVYGQFYAAAHADWICPVGAWNFLMGVRAQYSYSALDVIPGTQTGLHDLGVLLTAGLQW